MRKTLWSVSLFALCALVVPPASGQIIISFDENVGFAGPLVKGTPVQSQLLITNEFHPSGVLFESAGGGIVSAVSSEAISAPNVAGPSGPGPVVSTCDAVIATFWQATAPALADFVAIRLTASSLTTRMHAYDLLGNLLGTSTGAGGDVLTLTYAGSIRRVVIEGGPFFFDDFTFDTPTSTVQTFCTSKAGMACGPPEISASGVPSAAATSGFFVRSAPARSDRLGFLLYNTRLGTPLAFQGGTLCVSGSMLRRAGPAYSEGTGCLGVFSVDMNAFSHGLWVVPPNGTLRQTSPQPYLRAPGTAVHAQFWGRDTIATGSYLSNGVSWIVTP